MKKTTQLKQLLLAPEVLVVPGSYDALSARIIEKAGFLATQATGYGIAASVLGKPDIGLLSFGEMLDQTRNIAQAVQIPVMADGDTGFGNAVNVYHTVQRFEQAGCAGINLEDQVFPKRCGHMDGKQVISLAEMVGKIKAATAARVDEDFVINARTDAVAVYGVDEAIRRGNAYAAAGADLIFAEAPRDKESVARLIREIKAPVSINMVDGGKTPPLSIDELQALGAARVSVPVSCLFLAAKAMQEGMRALYLEHKIPAMTKPESILTFAEFTELVDLPFYKQLEAEYVTGIQLPEESSGRTEDN